jgi:cell wall-associated NlpC family hydrolase
MIGCPLKSCFLFKLSLSLSNMKAWPFIFCGMIATQSCVFVVSDKNATGQLSSTDTSSAKTANDSAEHIDSLENHIDSLKTSIDSLKKDSTVHEFFSGTAIHTKNIHPQQVVEFAKTLIGIPYRYASTDPKIGFDCSGFITYVFNHFNIIVPRSSIDFTNVGKEVSPQAAKAGDLILFTGTDSTERFVGHMGLVISNENGQLNFIHSSSGKKNGVIITPLSDYYKSRYMKTVRIFPENG